MGYPSTNRPDTTVGSATHGVAVDISSTDHKFNQPTRGLYVGGAGNVIVKLQGDPATSLTFTAVPAGTTLALRIHTVVRTSTTATAMIALF